MQALPTPPLDLIEVAPVGVVIGSVPGLKAALSTNDPPQPPMLKAKSSGPAAITRIGMGVSPKPVTLVPAPYPHDLSAPLVVPDYLQVDTSSPAFIGFSSQLDNVIQLLGKSNRIEGETREQLIAEIKAGREILISPRTESGLSEVAP